jgi:hypothetical protein
MDEETKDNTRGGRRANRNLWIPDVFPTRCTPNPFGMTRLVPRHDLAGACELVWYLDPDKPDQQKKATKAKWSL